MVMALALVSALAVLAMMGVTCVDVVMRMCGTALRGSQDLVRVAGAMAAGCALPYVTALKGHVAVEFFFQKLGGIGRIVVDTLMRLMGIALFATFTRCCLWQAHASRSVVYDTLPIHHSTLYYLLAVCCAVTVLVIVYNLLHPGREMVKP